MLMIYLYNLAFVDFSDANTQRRRNVNIFGRRIIETVLMLEQKCKFKFQFKNIKLMLIYSNFQSS